MEDGATMHGALPCDAGWFHLRERRDEEFGLTMEFFEDEGTREAADRPGVQNVRIWAVVRDEAGLPASTGTARQCPVMKPLWPGLIVIL